MSCIIKKHMELGNQANMDNGGYLKLSGFLQS